MAQDRCHGKSCYLGSTDDPLIQEVSLPVMDTNDTESAADGHIWLSLLFICIFRNHRVRVVADSDSP